MTATEGLLTVYILATLGAALGTKNGNADAWKGAVALIVAAAIGIGIQILFQINNVFLIVVAQIIVMGIVGAIFKLTGRQNASVVLGSVLGGAIGAAIASAF